MKKVLMAIICLIVCFLFVCNATAKLDTENTEQSDIKNRIMNVKIPFIANSGQTDANVAFYAQTFAGTVFITKQNDIVYKISDLKENNAGIVALKESFEGRNNAVGEGVNLYPAKVSYFKGKDRSKWVNNIETYEIIHFKELYQGIDLKLKAYGKNVEKFFCVKPSGEPEKIRVKLNGSKTLNINRNGELEITTELGVITFTKPVAYQDVNSQRNYVAAAYVTDGYEYGFKLGDYDKNEMVIIDPLIASTYLGGSNYDFIYSTASDENGNIYVPGVTISSDFPTVMGYDPTHNGTYKDVFIAKFENNLTNLLAATFLGGNDEQFCYAIALKGNYVYVSGWTSSPDFPTTPGSYTENINDNEGGDAFISKLDNNLTTLIASTFIGGSESEEGGLHIIFEESSSNLYVSGWTVPYGTNVSSNFPTTQNSYDKTFNGKEDLFILKIDSNLTTLLASTFIGGSEMDQRTYMAMDKNGNVYLTGGTDSTDFPTTPSAYDTTHNGGRDNFITIFDNNLTKILASTFLGGSNLDGDGWTRIALDESGSVYVAGYTNSSDFPIISECYDQSHNGGYDIFVSKLNSTLSTLFASTFIGGTQNDIGYSMALDQNANVYITGWTLSSDYPTTYNAYDRVYNGGYDVIVTKISRTLKALHLSSFIGGSKNDYGRKILLDENNNIIISGNTVSTDFPVKQESYDTSYNGGDYDVFVLKIDNITIGPDVNDDGIVNLIDAILILQELSGMEPSQVRDDYISSGIDSNGDDKSGLEEVIYSLQVVAKMRP